MYNPFQHCFRASVLNRGSTFLARTSFFFSAHVDDVSVHSAALNVHSSGFIMAEPSRNIFCNWFAPHATTQQVSSRFGASGHSPSSNRSIEVTACTSAGQRVKHLAGSGEVHMDFGAAMEFSVVIVSACGSAGSKMRVWLELVVLSEIRFFLMICEWSESLSAYPHCQIGLSAVVSACTIPSGLVASCWPVLSSVWSESILVEVLTLMNRRFARIGGQGILPALLVYVWKGLLQSFSWQRI